MAMDDGVLETPGKESILLPGASPAHNESNVGVVTT
jgi:hypothetical protein